MPSRLLHQSRTRNESPARWPRSAAPFTSKCMEDITLRRTLRVRIAIPSARGGLDATTSIARAATLAVRWGLGPHRCLTALYLEDL